MTERHIIKCDRCSGTIDDKPIGDDGIPFGWFKVTLINVALSDPPFTGGASDIKNMDLCTPCASLAIDVLRSKS